MRILLALDGSPSADRARALVASLSWPQGSLVRLVAAMDVAPALWGSPWIPALPTDIETLEAETVADLARVLEVARSSLEEAGLTVEQALLRGRPGAAIVDDANLWRPDLVVVGSRGHGPLGTALLGSVSASVADNAPCPVLVARGEAVARIVLADDGSPAAIAARDVVGSWSALAAIPVLVVGVVDVAAPWHSGIAPTMFAAALDIYTEMLASERALHRGVVAASVAHLSSRRRAVEGELRNGDPADQICRAAADPAGDLIVIGSRGHVGLSRLVMGSVAHAVLTHSRCSVLVVRRSPGVG